MRKAELTRETKETKIKVSVCLDGSGKAEIATGIGFFDHMLTHLARHGLLDLMVSAEGDLHIDAHHTVEDIGICLGEAVHKAVGDPKGLARYGHAVIPMDESLAEVAIDFSGRPYLHFDALLSAERIGEFDSELTEEFFRAFAVHAKLNLHIVLRHGKNAHHCVEGIFKAFARALRQALTLDPRVKDVPSTKGMLQA